MTKQARLTSKGQITIPRDVRRALGVRAGDKLQFEQEGKAFRVTPIRKHSPFAKYAGIGAAGIAGGRKGIVRWVRTLRGK
ncbi:MAG TPA: AbrB/MazE/SpoVT family DNA-binding domain-containing protein [Candidatus Acidoferrales bacterium]|nr:AbrB/MazE/SpoVT family DNA-binding domain-containing protein [Candidatus Acidoferrales bacterium]